MKKIAITVFALALATCGFAQKKNVSNAEAKLYDPVDYAGAKKLIEAAMEDPTTSNQAKTYWVASQVYFGLFSEQGTKKDMNQEYDIDDMSNNLIKAVDAYKKVAELDAMPNEKGQVKPKYAKQITQKLNVGADCLFNTAADNYFKQKYGQAVALWSKYIDLADSPAAEKLNLKSDTTYNQVKSYIIDASVKKNDGEFDAIALKYMEDLKADPKYSRAMYEWSYQAYSKKGDSEKTINTLKEAIKKFPNDNSYFVGSLINYYRENNKDAEALSYLDEAIASNPKETQYYLIKAQIFLRKENFDKAIECSKQAIGIQADNFNANYFCGYSYIRKGETAMDAAGKIKDNTKYKKAKDLALEQFKTAVTYLEKARSIDAKDVDNLNLLKNAYYRLGNGTKYNEIDDQIKKLK